MPYPQSEQLHLLQYQRQDAAAKLQSSAVLHPAAEQLYQQFRQWQQAKTAQTPASTPAQTPVQPQIMHALLYLEQEIVMSDAAQPRLSAAYTTPELQQMLGMPLLLGPGFTEAQMPGAMNPGVILSYQAWQLLFQQRPDVLSQKITINGVSHPVLGVLSNSVVSPQLRSQLPPVDLWLPWDYNCCVSICRRWRPVVLWRRYCLVYSCNGIGCPGRVWFGIWHAVAWRWYY